MLRYRHEDTGRKSHVEDSVALFASMLDLFNVLVELLEWLILIVLASDVCADVTELIKLLLNLFCRGLDVLSDSLEVLCSVHLRSCIADDLDVFG